MRRFVSVVLIAALLAAAAAPVCSAAEGLGGSRIPEVYIGPLGNADIYENPDASDERILFRPPAQAVISLLGRLLPAAVMLTFTRDYNAFGDVLIKLLNDSMGAMKLDGCGNSADNVSVKLQLPEDPDADSYYFHYDWRLDSVEAAAQLKNFVDYIKELTGCKTVNFRASSMGGVIAMAYFNEYGSSGVHACVFQCCPILGTAVAGDALCRKIKLDAKATLDYGTGAYPPADAEGFFLYFLFNFLYYSGILDAVIFEGGRLVSELKDRVYDEFMTPVLGTLLGIWSFVPDDTYEQAKSLNLNSETQAGLIAKADYYHYNIQQRAKEILTAAAENGTKLMIVAGTGMQRTPLVESIDADSDATVDVTYASAGAFAAKRGEVLPDGYVQQINDGKNHISPDRTIDASTCILPDNTWFIKGMLHANCHDGISEMYDKFMNSDEITDVWSDSAYPQFMLNDKPNKRLIPLGNFAEGTPPPETQAGHSFYDAYVKFCAPAVNAVFSALDFIREKAGL